MRLCVKRCACAPGSWGGVHGWANFYFAVAAGGLVTALHRGNIQRLVAGTESRFGTSKPQS